MHSRWCSAKLGRHFCSGKGDVELRGGLGQRFAAHLREHADAASTYASFRCQKGSREAKKAFRVQWAQSELQSRVVLRRSKLEVLEEMVGHKGVYMAFDRICVVEGELDNPHAVRRAKAYTMHCVSKGAPFVEWNAMKEDTEARQSKL